jgi:nitroreductase
MPDALELLKTRRSVKPMELEGPAPAPSEIETLLKIASRVPDHGKLTPWRFIVFEGNARAVAGDTIAAAYRAEWEQQLSAGASAMSLVFAAHALGYAASWITEWYAYDRRVLDELGIALHERVAGFVHIGRPAKPPEDRDRPKLDAIVTRFGA